MNVLFAIGIVIILIALFIFIDADLLEFKIKKIKKYRIGLILSIGKLLLATISFFYFVLSATVLRSVIIGIGITAVVVIIFWIVSFFFTGKLFYNKKKHDIEASQDFVYLSARVLTVIKNSIVSAVLIGIVLYKTGILSKL